MRKRRRLRREWIFVLYVLGCVIMGITVARLVKSKQAVPAISETSEMTETASVLQKPVKITISAAGDCTLGSDPRFSYAGSFHAQYDAAGDFSYFFKNVKDIFAADDLTVVNLEGTFTTATKAAEKAFTFKGPAAYTKILTEGSVEAVTLANNHTYDFLEEGYQDTKQALKRAKLAYADKKNALLYTVFPDTDKKPIYRAVADAKAEAEKEGISVGIAAFAVWYDDAQLRRDIRETIEALRKEGAAIVLVFCHWGIEGDHYPNADQCAIGKYAIDAGADAVLGHHPHVVQGIETYKGKKIVYSMGNFCFGGNTNPSDMDCFIYQLTYEVIDKRVTGEYTENCIPCRISSVTERNNYQPTPLEGKEKARALERIKTYSAF